MTDKETEDKMAETESPDYNGGELDAAGKSLAEALRVSFLILADNGCAGGAVYHVGYFPCAGK